MNLFDDELCRSLVVELLKSAILALIQYLWNKGKKIVKHPPLIPISINGSV